MKEFKQGRIWIAINILMYVGLLAYFLYIMIIEWSTAITIFIGILSCIVILWAFGSFTWQKDIYVDDTYLTLVPLTYYVFKWPNKEKILLKDIQSITIDGAIPRMMMLNIITKKSYPKSHIAGVLGISGDYMEYLIDKVPKDCSMYNMTGLFKQKRIK